MDARIYKPDHGSEWNTPELCFILENWNDPDDPAVSVARARVPAGVSTKLHRLTGIDERYLVIAGAGRMHIGDGVPQDVGPEDVVIIPAGTAQKIENIGTGDLVFYCICTPRFTPECYEELRRDDHAG